MWTGFISDVLFGPSLKVLQKKKQNFPSPDFLDISDENFKFAGHLLQKWGLRDAPCVISEDGTALQARVDIQATRGQVRVFGLCGGSFVVTSVEDLLQQLETRPLATIVYAYSLVPLIDGAPSIPLFAITHDNSNATFSTDYLLEVWKYVWKVSMS